MPPNALAGSPVALAGISWEWCRGRTTGQGGKTNEDRRCRHHHFANRQFGGHVRSRSPQSPPRTGYALYPILHPQFGRGESLHGRISAARVAQWRRCLIAARTAARKIPALALTSCTMRVTGSFIRVSLQAALLTRQGAGIFAVLEKAPHCLPHHPPYPYVRGYGRGFAAPCRTCAVPCRT